MIAYVLSRFSIRGQDAGTLLSEFVRRQFLRTVGVLVYRLLLLGLLWCGGFGPQVSSAAASGDGNGLKLLTWNIHHGAGADGRLDLDRIAALIREVEPDLVALQEVDRGVARTDRRNLPEELAKLTSMAAVFSNNYSFQGGEYGNAILSRLPVLSWTNRHFEMLREGEQRGLLEVRVRWGQQVVRFFSTHLDYRPDDTERFAHCRFIRSVLEGDPDLPAVVAGDFNAMPDSPVLGYLHSFLDDAWLAGGDGDGWSFPSGEPARRIDYLLLWPSCFHRVAKSEVVRSDGSDHLPVVTTLIATVPESAP